MSSRIKFFDKKFLILLAILAFSLIGGFGLNLGMNIASNGKMSSCNLMSSESGICQMNLNDHLTQWQQMFTASFNASLLPLLLLAFTFSLAFTTLFRDVEYMFLQLHQRYKRENSIFKLFDYLLLAFSRGILHPQIYA